MSNGVKFVLALIASALLMLAIRAFLFTVYSVPSDGLTFKKGDRVIVNKVALSSISRGDDIVFTDSTADYIGTIMAVPGDTIILKGQRYLIPQRCCKRCGCPDCKYYLINTGKAQQLVHKHLFVGKAYKLFHFGF
nr:signal peptidase I [Prevotella sp.]